MAECDNMAPASFVGHWRDWHRGHGCNLDDGKRPPIDDDVVVRRDLKMIADLTRQRDEATEKWEEWKRIAYNWKQDCDDLLAALKSTHQQLLVLSPRATNDHWRANVSRALLAAEAVIAKTEGK